MCITPRCASLGVKLHGMHPTTESSSAVCIAQRSQVIKNFLKTLRCASHCRVWLSGMHYTTESDSVVCFSPRSLTPGCASHRRVKLRGVHYTAESDSAVCIPPPSQYLPSVCFDSKLYKCNFSLMPEDINVKIILSQIVWGTFFTSDVFFKNVIERRNEHKNRIYLMH